MHKTNREEQEEDLQEILDAEIAWVFQGFCQVFSRCRFDS